MVPMILTLTLAEIIYRLSLTLENLYCTIQLAAYWPLGFFALLARGPGLIGEDNLFPRVVSGLFFASLFGKCLEQTRW